MTTKLPAVSVQFSGNAKTYDYLVATPEDDLMIRTYFTQLPLRAVVPTKLREDGELSLSIANIVKYHEPGATDVTRLKPVIVVLHPKILEGIKSVVANIDNLEAQLKASLEKGKAA